MRRVDMAGFLDPPGLEPKKRIQVLSTTPTAAIREEFWPSRGSLRTGVFTWAGILNHLASGGKRLCHTELWLT